MYISYKNPGIRWIQVVGDSVIEAAICDGDWVTVRRRPAAENGDIVTAMLGTENEPIPGDDATILGKVVAVLRRVWDRTPRRVGPADPTL